MFQFIVLILVIVFCGNIVIADTGQNVLSSKDADIYRQIFSAHKKGQFKTAKSLEAKLKDKSLMGYVLYDRYFSKSYKTKKEEIRSWLSRYNGLAVADDVYALGQQKKANLAGLKPVGLFGSRTGACTFVMREEPIDLVKNWSFSRYGTQKRNEAKRLMNQIARYIARGKTLNAKNIVESERAQKLFNRLEHDSARTALAFSYFLDNENELALQYANRAIRTSGSKIPLAYWTAGLTAWRMGDYMTAADYFEQTAGLEKTYPLLRASSAFWAARANLRVGNYEKVGDYLELASEYPRTFYGFMAMRLLGQDLTHVWDKPATNQDDIVGDFSHPALKRFYALRQVGQDEWAKRELSKLYVEADKEAKGVLLMISEQNGFDDELLAVSGELVGNSDTRYPAPKWVPVDGWKADKALVFSFVKQESCFNARAQSSVGATGLMQIMPDTGRELAKSLQFPWSLQRLKDPEYNLALGQNYLLKLMDNGEVNYNLIFAAVAYNAGPGNLAKWKKRMDYQNDPLLFIESIPSKETRSFVERILVNYWVYRSLMGQPLHSLDDVVSGLWPIYKAKDL